MIRFAAILCSLSIDCLATAAEAPDLLRFTNGDQLHGTFLGIKDGPQAMWHRQDLATTVDFKTTQIRHIVLHGGFPLKPLGTLSHLGLVNGDRVPGTITHIGTDAITLDTSFAGRLTIPRAQVAMMAPNPLGGRVYYHGPFVENEWRMTHPALPNGIPDDPKADAPGRWLFSGSAWYWKHKQGGTALIRETGMPDRAVLRFNLAWKNRLCLVVGFHADFARAQSPKPDARPSGFILGDASDLPCQFGNSYVLQLFSNYLMLYRTSVNDDGKPCTEQVQLNQNNSNLRLLETGEAQVELRSNRLTGAISLFINEEFIAQWSESHGSGRPAETFAGKGSGFGFMVQNEDSPVRISDVTISEWNGMPDSARSMHVDDQDVVLMTNGTDRYAGRVGNLDDHGKVSFDGKHGQFHFPLEEVAEIRFARNRLAQAADDPADKVVVRFAPLGSVAGRAMPSDGGRLSLLNTGVGALDLSLESAVMLDFNCSKQIIDHWDVDF